VPARADALMNLTGPGVDLQMLFFNDITNGRFLVIRTDMTIAKTMILFSRNLYPSGGKPLCEHIL
jgi:hypothetical protein